MQVVLWAFSFFFFPPLLSLPFRSSRADVPLKALPCSPRHGDLSNAGPYELLACFQVQAEQMQDDKKNKILLSRERSTEHWSGGGCSCSAVVYHKIRFPFWMAFKVSRNGRGWSSVLGPYLAVLVQPCHGPCPGPAASTLGNQRTMGTLRLQKSSLHPSTPRCAHCPHQCHIPAALEHLQGWWPHYSLGSCALPLEKKLFLLISNLMNRWGRIERDKGGKEQDGHILSPTTSWLEAPHMGVRCISACREESWGALGSQAEGEKHQPPCCAQHVAQAEWVSQWLSPGRGHAHAMCQHICSSLMC